MQTIHQQTAAQRMAQWWATGGALDAAEFSFAGGAAAHPESGRDDGLACGPTGARTCYADDGLTAGGVTASGPPPGCR